MINKLLLYVCFSLSIFMQAMDKPLKDPNIALLQTMIDGPIDMKKLWRINALFDEGADPNFASPMCGITPLMRAVRLNSPHLVRFLLLEGSRVNVCDPQGRFVRDFNCMYARETIEPMVNSITHCMRRIQRHNTLNPAQRINYQAVLCCLQQSQIICNAVMIDKRLEDCRAYSDFSKEKHPLIKMLADADVKKALSFVFISHWKHLPRDIRYELYCPTAR